jgi:hypothetical protein
MDSVRAATLRELYPQLAEVRVEFEFQDGTTRSPSSQSFAYFPAARGFFKYACPCHNCSGEFDLSGFVAELAGKGGRTPRSRSVRISCTGQRAHEHINCPICAQIRVSAVLHTKD